MTEKLRPEAEKHDPQVWERAAWWQAVVQAIDGGSSRVVLRCEHKHRHHDTALRCARRLVGWLSARESDRAER